MYFLKNHLSHMDQDILMKLICHILSMLVMCENNGNCYNSKFDAEMFFFFNHQSKIEFHLQMQTVQIVSNHSLTIVSSNHVLHSYSYEIWT